MACLLHQGVEAYEPRVVHQLLDFMYGYVSGVLQDAEVRTPSEMWWGAWLRFV